MKNTLLIAYGNPDRQDDGVAWKVLEHLGQGFGITSPFGEEAIYKRNDKTYHFVYMLQLLPELSEIISKYEQVIFIDAHTENITEEISITELSASYQRSPFTHHMTPQTCLELTRSIYKAEPKALMVSIRGYHFSFEDHLSEQTARLVPLAVQKINNWLERE